MVTQKSTGIPRDSFLSRDEFEEQRDEFKAQIAAGVLDVGITGSDTEDYDPSVKGPTAPSGSGLRTVKGSPGACFRALTRAFGCDVGAGICSVVQIPDSKNLELRHSQAQLKVFYEYFGQDDARNHVVAVSSTQHSARLNVIPESVFFPHDSPKVVGVTSAEQFFNKSNAYANIRFYAEGETSAAFGGDVANTLPFTGRPNSNRSGRRDPSITDDRASSGQANVSGGVKRNKRRVVPNRSKFSPSGHVAKSYASSSGLMFNNLNEMFQDTISRDLAQEIIEAVFEHWGVPGDDPNALKYSEDLICAFFIATTASNKADYEFVFSVPTYNGEIDADFGVLSRTLADQFGVTRRQFARGIADDMKRYLKDPENVHLLSKLADRSGCDPQNAFLVFDGSTHCSGLTSAQLTFTKLLESRNLFEDEALLSQGASQTLMEGIHGRVRSKVQR